MAAPVRHALVFRRLPCTWRGGRTSTSKEECEADPGQDVEDSRFEAVLRLPFAHCGLVGHVGRGTGGYAGRCLGRLLIDLDLGDDLGRPKMMGERDEAARDQAAKPVYSAHTARFHVLTNPAGDATGTGIGE